MERHLHQSLDTIRQHLLRMGALVERMISDSVQALIERDDEIATAVRARDLEVDGFEKMIDDECNVVLATQQPTAVDLRFILSALKITNDLERIGDEAVNIAKAARKANAGSEGEIDVDLPRMAELACVMVRDALAALVRKDTRLASEVCNRDSELDKLYRKVFKRLMESMGEGTQKPARALFLVMIARNLERVGDHATNVAEDVIYLVEGRDVRHPAIGEVGSAVNPVELN